MWSSISCPKYVRFCTLMFMPCCLEIITTLNLHFELFPGNNIIDDKDHPKSFNKSSVYILSIVHLCCVISVLFWPILRSS